MKKTILVPMMLGLLLSTGCSQDDSKIASSNSNTPADSSKTDAKQKSEFAATGTPAQPTATATSPTPAPAPVIDPKPADPASPIASATSSSGSLAPATEKLDTSALAMNSSDAAKAAIPQVTTPATTEGTMPTPGPANIASRVTEWKLSAADIKDEFERTGRVERTKAPAPGGPTGPMDGGMITNLVRAKLDSDATLSSLNLSIETKGDVVTLAGTAPGLEQIGRAVAFALDTEGVNKAVSTIKLASATP